MWLWIEMLVKIHGKFGVLKHDLNEGRDLEWQRVIVAA